MEIGREEEKSQKRRLSKTTNVSQPKQIKLEPDHEDELSIEKIDDASSKKEITFPMNKDDLKETNEREIILESEREANRDIEIQQLKERNERLLKENEQMKEQIKFANLEKKREFICKTCDRIYDEPVTLRCRNVECNKIWVKS